MTQEEIDDLMNDVNSIIKSSNGTLEEMDFMKKDIEFLQNEYKTNKRYFCSEGSKPTINDVIKTVYELALASKSNYDYNRKRE